MERAFCPACGALLPSPADVCPACGAPGLQPSQARTTQTGFTDTFRRSDRVGPYKILERLGEGGMGVVYLADQEHPFRRRVALKVIKIGMDTREVVARFEAERQALALMDHTCIARVYDAGASDEGRPYFAMEYVAGIPITEYCDKHRLSIPARLELFMQACSGIQHAHQKGIIHRDIKPSNVLVAIRDGKPEAKVIDFGVAKAINQRLTEKTVFTQQGVLIGTPAYMSPEQAEMGGTNIDTTTDIYSLGALLYELLVGVTPFDTNRLRGAAYAEIQRIIREEEPPRPSARLSTSRGTGDAIAHQRRTHHAALVRELKGDLDWITLKAMEKDRTRRYASASELAADVMRHLTTDPVVARPVSVRYRASKFLRKHSVAVISAALGVTAATVVSAAFQAQVVVAVTAQSLITQAEFIGSNVQHALEDSAPDQSLSAANNSGLRRALESALYASAVVAVMICDTREQILIASDPQMSGTCRTESPVQEVSSVNVLAVLRGAIARRSDGYVSFQPITNRAGREVGSIRVFLSQQLVGEEFRRQLAPVAMLGIAQIVAVAIVTIIASWFVLRRE